MNHLNVLVIVLLCLQTQHATASNDTWSWLSLFYNPKIGLSDFRNFKNGFMKRYFSESLQNKFFSSAENASTTEETTVSVEPTTTTTTTVTSSTECAKQTDKTQKPDQSAKWPYRNFIKKEKMNRGLFFTKTSPDGVRDDPSELLSTPQMIARNGYPAESHSVVTEDGYILTIHRIPHSLYNDTISHKTVLLHHGLLGSSADWVLSGKEKGLAYMLSDAGYDVWLANARGNTYSRAHASRRVDSYAFWNFTFHEVAQYDLPAVIDFIRDRKGPDAKLNYIGHSMGTTVLFALLSTKPEYNKHLRAGFALAPVAYMTNIRSPLWLIAKFSDDLEYLFKLLGTNEFLPQSGVLNWLSKHACELNHYEQVICENSLFVICGHDPKQFNRTLLPVILGHVPAGASTKTLIHYAQEIRAQGKFQQFDYGKVGNLKQYGTPEPPEYPVDKITLPIALLSAENDWLASEADVRHLYEKLQNGIEHYVVPLKEFNHIDFLWAIDAPTLVYEKLFELMTRDIKKNTGLLDDNEIYDSMKVQINYTKVPKDCENETCLYKNSRVNSTSLSKRIKPRKKIEKRIEYSDPIKSIEHFHNFDVVEKSHHVHDTSMDMQEFENEHNLSPDENEHINNYASFVKK